MAKSGSYPSSAELRLVLLGTLGCGKTASADTILGQVAPPTTSSFGSSSRVCRQRQGMTEGRNVTVIEAPRWYWNGRQVEDSVRRESRRALQLAAPGPHAFLLLIPVCQFTEVEGRVPAEMMEMFGPEVLNHTLVLLTCGDYLAGQTEEMYLQGEDPGLREVIGQCGGRYHIINNRQRHDREQVRTLLGKVEHMLALNGGPYSPQKETTDQAITFRKRPSSMTETHRLLAEDGQRKDSVDYREQPFPISRTRRSAEWAPSGREGGGHRDNGLDAKYSVAVDSSVSDQLNAGRATPPSSPVKPNERRIPTTYEELQRVREQSTRTSPSYPSSQSSSSYSSSLLSPSTSARLPSSSSSAASSSSQRASSSSSQLPSSSSSLSSSQQAYSSSSSSAQPTYSSSSSSSQQAYSSSSSSLQQAYSSSSSSSKQPYSSSSSSSQPTYSSSSSSSQQTYSSSSSSPQQPYSSSSSSSKQPYSSSSSSSQLPSSTSSASSSYSTSSSPELRLVLLGNSGAGKSAAGNSILGKEEFETQPNSLVPVTQQCEKRKALVMGRKVAVIDTPDWFQSESSPEEVRALISSCVALSSPGPHAFLMCVPLDRPARSELQALGVLEAVFGAEAVHTHTLLLLTHADQLRASGKLGEGQDVEAHIVSARPDLLKLVERCGDRFHVLERGAGGAERRSVEQLLEKVEQTVREAGGRCYSCPAFQEAEERVRQRQREIASERKGGGGGRVERGSPRLGQRAMETLAEVDEEDQEDIRDARDEAERTVGTMRLESLPPITASVLSPSLMTSVREMISSTAKWLPKALADSSVLVGDGVKNVAKSPVWEKVGSGAKGVHRIMADSAVWEKVRASAGGVAKPIADSAVWEKIGANKVPGLMSDSSSVVRSRAKMVADSAMWGKVGSGAKTGAKLMTDGSVWVGSGAKTLAQSPVWGQVGSGAKSGAKMMADGSVRVGAGLGAGVKKVAQSPVWGKMGSSAKAGVKMVAESSVWEKMMTQAKKVPLVVAGGALLGLVLGVIFGGALGGAVGAAAGSAVSEVGRRKFSKEGSGEQTKGAAMGGMRNNMSEAERSLLQSGQQLFKAE